jgi:hypothetical protein
LATKGELTNVPQIFFFAWEVYLACMGIQSKEEKNKQAHF